MFLMARSSAFPSPLQHQLDWLPGLQQAASRDKQNCTISSSANLRLDDDERSASVTLRHEVVLSCRRAVVMQMQTVGGLQVML